LRPVFCLIYLNLSHFFHHGAAAGRARFNAFSVNSNQLQIWVLAARYFGVGVAHMVGASGGFVANITGSRHTVESLVVFKYNLNNGVILL
jgi:hypothetical protein